MPYAQTTGDAATDAAANLIRRSSTAEGAVEEGGEEVLGLTQRLPLHRTQALHSLHQGRELLLEGRRVALGRASRESGRGSALVLSGHTASAQFVAARQYLAKEASRGTLAEVPPSVEEWPHAG